MNSQVHIRTHKSILLDEMWLTVQLLYGPVLVYRLYCIIELKHRYNGFDSGIEVRVLPARLGRSALVCYSPAFVGRPAAAVRHHLAAAWPLATRNFYYFKPFSVKTDAGQRISVRRYDILLLKLLFCNR